MNPQRIRNLNSCPEKPGPVVYWMSRDQRVADNWALIFAKELAEERSVPVAVVFCLVPMFGDAAIRQYAFMLRGVQEVESRLDKLGIPFFLLTGSPQDKIPVFLKANNAGVLVTDFDPLRIKREWKDQVVSATEIPAYEVDAHNIVPCWIASVKQEYGAYTFRPKLNRLLPEFMDKYPPVTGNRRPWVSPVHEADWKAAEESLTVDRSISEVSWIEPGEDAALRMMRQFIDEKLADYPQKRNDPSLDGQSNLSPYLHFGQISAQRVAIEAGKSGRGAPEFLEELIVRRELSDNFCCYNKVYDTTGCFPDWAKRTLDEHLTDPRPEIYSIDELEHAHTHDPLWNACQMEMVGRGKMHAYMRMYWAKKILEWTHSPEEAMQTCIYLNDRYELDGRDPNGYVGIAWSIGGVHDRAWGQRPIFGKVRYMSYEGCERKFDVNKYIQNVHEQACYPTVTST